MSEREAGQGREPAAAIAYDPLSGVQATYSKDYWDNVFEQLGRRRLVKLALAVLALLYGSAIYAPLIANDRPYVLEAVDRKEYDAARRGLVGVTGSLVGLAEKGEVSFREEQVARGREQTFSEALASEEQALGLRLDTMRAYLDEELHEPLTSLQERVGGVVQAALGSDREASQAAASAAREEARRLRAAYEPRAPDEDEGAGGVELRGVKSYPLAESTTALEVFFMVLWGLILTWPLWNRLVNRGFLAGDRDRIRRARRSKFGGALGLSVMAALVWQVTVGGSMTFDVSGYKDGLTAGDITARRVVFPPLNLGFAETHQEESYRPPTWKTLAEIDERGYYVRGPRVPAPDAITGHMPSTMPVEVRWGEPERNGAWRHFLGTDILGRDLFVRILYGGRISLTVGLLSTVLLIFIGVTIGAIAGYMGGRIDILLSRLIEIVQSMPAFFLIITAVALVPEKVMKPIFAIVLFIAVIRWTGVARLVRGEFLKLKEQDFVVAARAGGLSNRRVIFRHVLPNAMGPVLVAAAFSVAAGILTESSISFLGFGISHPIPSWGSLINETRSVEYWWIQVFPGFLIFLTVLCYNLVGEGIRDALDPRMKV